MAHVVQIIYLGKQDRKVNTKTVVGLAMKAVSASAAVILTQSVVKLKRKNSKLIKCLMPLVLSRREM